MKPPVSIIISNRNDVAMLAVTVRSCIEELRPLNGGEIIIADNSDPFFYSRVLEAIPQRYVREGVVTILRQDFPCLFTAREMAISRAKSDYVLCLDSHMICGRDMIVDLVRSINKRSSDPTLGFIHAPINWAHQHEVNSKHDRDMSKTELGDWNFLYNIERTISWKGMPWICKKDWFLYELGGYGALSQHLISWGGGDMHIGIKPWLLGYKNWAIPCSPGIHIGPFPSENTSENVVDIKKGDKEPYRRWTESGNGPAGLGFLVSCFVLGGESMMRRNKEAIEARFGRFLKVEKYWDTAISMGSDERKWLLENQKMSFDELLLKKPWENSSGRDTDLSNMEVSNS
jgi:hypothetical protein